MEATKPSTFAVHFTENCDLPDFHCENAIGEQLCGVRKEPSKYQGLPKSQYSNHVLQFSATKQMLQPVTICANGWLGTRTKMGRIIGSNAFICDNQRLG